jgi:hypothetical protein
MEFSITLYPGGLKSEILTNLTATKSIFIYLIFRQQTIFKQKTILNLKILNTHLMSIILR